MIARSTMPLADGAGRARDARSLAALDEPVRRYLTHALGEAGAAPTHVRLRMVGRIDVGRWLSFTAEQQFDEGAFSWRARVGWRSLKVLDVVDSYADGAGCTDGRLLGRLRFLHATDANTTRAAAARAAVERIWVPGMLLPEQGVVWRAVSDELIVARFAVAPECPEIFLHITPSGAVRSASVLRWGNVGQDGFGYIPFGAVVHAERRFGDVVLPSAVTVGWWFGTPRFKPFFVARVRDAQPV
jgi:hypothetical protein